MSLQSIRRAVESPIREALLGLDPPITPLTENESYAENTSREEFALIALSFGLMTEPSIGCAMDEFIRASLVVDVFTQKNTGPGRAQEAAEVVIQAIVKLSNPVKRSNARRASAWPLGVNGPSFTPMEGRPHLATRITAPMQARVE